MDESLYAAFLPLLNSHASRVKSRAHISLPPPRKHSSLPTLDGVVDTKAVRDLFEAEFRKRMPTIRHRPETPSQ